MRKLLHSIILSFFFLGMALPFIAGPAQAAPALKAPISSAIVEAKRCEKCKRGKDGKMVCEEVECPE
jgi:hypothetical protein